MNIDGQADVRRRTGFKGLILKVFYGWVCLAGPVAYEKILPYVTGL